MSRIELLNNVTHKDTKVDPRYSAELGDNISSTVTFVTEFPEVQKEYPILFHVNQDSGEYQAVVLFGIQKDENLFLSDGGEDTSGGRNPGWNANYVPAVMARGPFSIGFQTQVEDGEERRAPVVHIDMEHPKVTSGDGIPVFLEKGGNSGYLENISRVLNLIRDGMQLNKQMFAAFNHYELLEDVTIDIELVNEDKHKMSLFKTINAEKLADLDGDALRDLSRNGFLMAAYFVVASMSNMKRLIDIKNRRLRS